ncbi:MAG TPA: hypothetical protein ENG51_09830 [Deltaproteobacteria bacterium]|nr:hypothetical protein [Deltaproteobacteria bacterium]
MTEEIIYHSVIPAQTNQCTARFAQDAKYAEKKSYCDLRIDDIHNEYAPFQALDQPAHRAKLSP